MLVFGALLGPEGPRTCVWCLCGGSPLVVDRSPCGVGVGAVVWGGCRAYVENCIVDASIFEFLWSSC